MRSVLTALAATLILAPCGAGAQLLAPPPVRPDAMMSALTAEVLGVLRQDHAAGRVTELTELVEKRVVPVFDFARMTRIALARNWRLASPEQQALLAAQFKTLLVRTYTRTLLEFRDQAIDYRPLRAAAGDTEVTVRSAMRRPGVEPLTIDYDMADGTAGWQVYDVKVAGVSLVLAYRESFAAMVRTSGIDGLIKSLEDKNRQNAPGARAPEAKLAPVARMRCCAQAIKGATMKIRPLHDRVIVKRLDEEKKTASGIVIPDTAAEKPDQGEVMAVGKGKLSDEGKLVPVEVKVGDRVLFGKYSGQTVRVKDDELLVMREEDIMGVVEGQQ